SFFRDFIHMVIPVRTFFFPGCFFRLDMFARRFKEMFCDTDGSGSDIRCGEWHKRIMVDRMIEMEMRAGHVKTICRRYESTLHMDGMAAGRFHAEGVPILFNFDLIGCKS